MPIWDSGPVIDGGIDHDPFVWPEKDPVTGVPPVGGIFRSVYRGDRIALAATESRVTKPNIGTRIAPYDPVLASILSGESG